MHVVVLWSFTVSAILDSQPSLGRGRASHPSCMIYRTAPGDLLEMSQFMSPEPHRHPLNSTALLLLTTKSRVSQTYGPDSGPTSNPYYPRHSRTGG
ncbi:hypothetical protein BDR22DRAFT_851113 [Usnea florida]